MNPQNIKQFILKHHFLTAALIMMAATVAMFSNTLFLSADRIISWQGTDTYSHFVYWRDFGFSQLRQGNLPLWNPQLYSGMPFFGGFQSALLYPLNWIFMFLPTTQAINISIVIHVFLIGAFMYLWTFSRGLHPAACLTAALLVMFSGANFMHIFAGHLIDICTMAWAPLIFLTIDRLFQRPSLGWHLLGIFAVSMQILAGHPQYVYYTAITVLLYVPFSLKGQNRPILALSSVAGVYAAAIGIAAIQLLTGIETARETVRSTGVTFQFASMFSYPPENIISLITPFFFGDIKTIPYWGRAYLWAMTFHIGITGFLLSLYGAVFGEKQTKRYAGVMVICLVVLALGKNTPIFHVFYNFFPGFNMFRGASKFIFPATLFLAMLAAIGMDSLIKSKISTNKLVYVLILTGAALFGGALLIIPPFNDFYPLDICRKLMRYVAFTGESYLSGDFYRDSLFLSKASLFSAKGLFFSTAIVFTLAIILALSKYSRYFLYLILFIAFVEIFSFAWHIKTDFDLRDTKIPELTNFLKNNPGDYRILNLISPNSALSTDAKDIWGYDPGVLLRYAQFIGFTQGYDPQKISNYIDFKENHRLLRMLRLRYIITPANGQIKILENKDYLPRLQIIEKWEVIPDKWALLKRMGTEGFDPRQTVLLEKSPGIADSIPGGTGSCRIIDQSTDHLTVLAKVSRDAILLITDTYSKGWQIAPLHAAGQRNYEILPGNYTLIAVPLVRGEHKLRLEYAPWSYRIGKWTSVFALSFYIMALIFYLHRRFRNVP